MSKLVIISITTLVLLISLTIADRDDHRKSKNFRASKRDEMRQAMDEAMRLLSEASHKGDPEQRRELLKDFMRGQINIKEALEKVGYKKKDPEWEEKIEKIHEKLRHLNRRKRYEEL